MISYVIRVTVSVLGFAYLHESAPNTKCHSDVYTRYSSLHCTFPSVCSSPASQNRVPKPRDHLMTHTTPPAHTVCIHKCCIVYVCTTCHSRH